MSKISATIAALNTRFNTITGLTCAKGLVRFPDSGTSLESIIEGLTENGVQSRMWISCMSRGITPAYIFGGAAIITGQMVIKLERHVTVDLSTWNNLVDKILNLSMQETGDAIDNVEPLSATADALPVETMDGYLWTHFEFEYKIPPCNE